MTNEETALADKILKEASADDLAHDVRERLLVQYDRVIRAAINRRDATEPRRQLSHATALLSSTDE